MIQEKEPNDFWLTPSLWEEIARAAAHTGETPRGYILGAVQARIVKEAPDPLLEILALLARHINHPRAERFLDRTAALWAPGLELTLDLLKRRRGLWEEVRKELSLPSPGKPLSHMLC